VLSPERLALCLTRRRLEMASEWGRKAQVREGPLLAATVAAEEGSHPDKGKRDGRKDRPEK
jgi:hypothetical protein